MQAQLFLDPRDGNLGRVALVRQAQEQRKAFDPVFNSAGSGQNQMGNPGRHVLIAARDKDLFAGDRPALFRLDGLGADGRKVRTRARFGQAHGRQHFARGKAGQGGRDLIFRAEIQDGAGRAGHQPDDHLKGVAGPRKDFGR